MKVVCSGSCSPNGPDAQGKFGPRHSKWWQFLSKWKGVLPLSCVPWDDANERVIPWVGYHVCSSHVSMSVRAGTAFMFGLVLKRNECTP